MFIVRDIFYLKFGHFKNAKALLTEANQNNIMPEAQSMRVLSDFTGDAYRLILEASFNSLAEYEESLGKELSTEDWQSWYARFKEHVERSHREILKQVL